MLNKCLIVDEMHSSIIPLLASCGLEADYQPAIERNEVLEIIHQYAGLLVRSKLKVDRELLENASKLVFIGRAGAGVDLIDVEEVEKRNIQLFNAPEGNRDALAEHAVGMLFALLNRIVSSDREVRQGLWRREANRGTELYKKTIALIGYGYMGRAFARRLSAFGCTILVYDNKPVQTEPGITLADMDTIYDEADVVSFHIPLTDETRSMADLSYFKRFKKHIWLVNTARGEILKLKDLVSLLKSGKILGAALDVLENEKFNKFSQQQQADFDELIRFENVILTPHIGGWSHESYVRINKVLIEKIRNSGLF